MTGNLWFKMRKGLFRTLSDKTGASFMPWKKRFQYEEVADENWCYDAAGSSASSSSCDETVMIAMDLPPGNGQPQSVLLAHSSCAEEPRFPKEKWKTATAFFLFVWNMVLVTISLSLVHERLPDRNQVPPLPDIFLDNVPAIDAALDISEIMIMVQTTVCIVLITFHKHRFIVMRRVFLMLSILYLMRAITMYVTVLPVSSTTYYCSPKLNATTALAIAKRALVIASGFGLSINGKHTFCGDYIFSGHTVMLVLGYLIISEYSSRTLFLLHWAAALNAFAGIMLVMIAHGHYTIDVLIAYYVTTRLFWSYHTLANNVLVSKTAKYNYISREWWFTLFVVFERNVPGPLPCKYDWPLPWPARFQPKNSNRVS